MISGEEQIQFFERVLFESLGKETNINSFDFVSGGCINNAVKLNTSQGTFFIKWNIYELEGMFEAEAKGLQILQEAQEIGIPQVYGVGQKEDKAYLLLEFISSSVQKKGFWEDFGASLACLHQHTQPYFGLDFDNYIGSLPQNNQKLEDGLDFFIEKRLKIQSGLALYNEQIDKSFHQKFQALYEKLPDILPKENASLLHGDLWSGNYMVNSEGKPMLIDPAVYYGNREAEIAFTRLFGGFEEAFYTAYQEEYPFEKGFEDRMDIYNLYPLLVHVNLFGSGYLSGVERILKKYLG
jgi:fructosamine-3-kinase